MSESDSLLSPGLPAIRLYRNAMSGEDCRNVIRRFLLDPRRKPGLMGSGEVGHEKTTVDLFLGLPGLEDLGGPTGPIFAAVGETMRRYKDDVPSFEYSFTRGYEHHDTGYIAHHYRSGTDDRFEMHSDQDPRTCRLLAGILYLNDVEEGGETEFEVHGRRLTVRPEEGAMLWFTPSWEYVHGGNRVIAGDKFIVSTFLVPSPSPVVATLAPGG